MPGAAAGGWPGAAAAGMWGSGALIIVVAPDCPETRVLGSAFGALGATWLGTGMVVAWGTACPEGMMGFAGSTTTGASWTVAPGADVAWGWGKADTAAVTGCARAASGRALDSGAGWLNAPGDKGMLLATP